MPHFKDQPFFASLPEDEKGVHFAQTDALHDTSLEALRDRIKTVMLPLLIRAFRFPHEPDRMLKLQEGREDCSFVEAWAQLKTLDHDLINLELWCQNCRSHIQRALDVASQPKPPPVIQVSRSVSPGKKMISLIARRVFGVRSYPARTESTKETFSWWRRFIKKKL